MKLHADQGACLISFIALHQASGVLVNNIPAIFDGRLIGQASVFLHLNLNNQGLLSMPEVVEGQIHCKEINTLRQECLGLIRRLVPAESESRYIKQHRLRWLEV